MAGEVAAVQRLMQGDQVSENLHNISQRIPPFAKVMGARPLSWCSLTDIV